MSGIIGQVLLSVQEIVNQVTVIIVLVTIHHSLLVHAKELVIRIAIFGQPIVYDGIPLLVSYDVNNFVVKFNLA